MKQLLFNSWSLMRILRLLMGGLAIAQAVYLHNWAIGLLGAFVFAQGLLNWSCCGRGTCALPNKNRQNKAC